MCVRMAIFVGLSLIGTLDIGLRGELFADSTDSAERDRLFSEVSKAHRNDRDSDVAFRAKCIYTRRHIDMSEEYRSLFKKHGKDPDAVEVTEFLCAFRGTSVSEIGVERGIDYVRVMNPEYSFGLSKEKSRSEYTIVHLERNGADARLDAKALEFGFFVEVGAVVIR